MVGILEEGILLVLVVAFFFNLFFALAKGGDKRREGCAFWRNG